MTPKAFRHELEPVVELAADLDGASADTRARLLEEHHAGGAEAIDRLWKKLDAAAVPELTWGESLMAAERRAMSKAFVEAPVVKTARLGDEPTDLAADSKLWEQIGVRLLAERGLESQVQITALFGADVDKRVLPPPAVLDAQSRALIEQLEGDGLEEHQLAALIQRFEASIVADTALNLTRLRGMIHAQLASFARENLPADFAMLNAWVYGTLFLTPASDPWLGMSTPGVFTGLPKS
jgi:hypothetical protein